MPSSPRCASGSKTEHPYLVAPANASVTAAAIGPFRGKGRAMAGKFELWTDKGGQWRFNLKASNGQVIATSEGYSSKASALAGIESVKNNAPGAPTVEV